MNCYTGQMFLLSATDDEPHIIMPTDHNVGPG